MKNGKIFNNIVPLLFIPLWLGLVTDFIKKIPWLHYTAIIITTLLNVFFLIRVIHELRIELDSHFNYQCRRMDRFIHRTQKRLQKIIVRTSDASVLDYALTKLHEICPPEVYSDIVTELSKKEGNPNKKKTLLFYNKQIGGHHEN
jgi:hypothetical protein